MSSKILNSVRLGLTVAAAFCLASGPVRLFGAATIPPQPASASIVSGDQQSAAVGQPFASSLAILVKTSTGAPASGRRVTFTGPSQGAACDFATGLASSVVVTTTTGLASVNCAAIGTPGHFTVSATVDGLAGPAGTLSFSLNVSAAALSIMPPTVTAAFAQTVVALNAASSTQLVVTLSNPGEFPLTGVAFSGALPAGLAASAPQTSCSAAPTVSGGTISLSGAVLAPASSCTVSAAITGTTPGMQTFTPASVSGGGVTGAPGNPASVLVVAPPMIAMAFAAPAIPLNSPAGLTLTVTNPGTVANLSGVGFSNSLPPGLAIASAATLTNSCGGTATAAPGGGSISLTGGTLAAGASCAVSVNVTAATPGAKTNSTGAVTSNEGGAGNMASANLDVLLPPAISIAFASVAVNQGAADVLTFTITAPAQNPAALTGVGFTNTLPAGFTVSGATSTSVCGGALAAQNGAGSIVLTGAVLGPGASCAFSVTVRAATAGNFLNTTGSIASANGGMGNSASASVNVIAPVSVTSSQSLPPATKGTPYGQALSASGGIGGYVWTLSSGSLPAGLSLDSSGAISGTPAAVGTSSFGATVTDGANATGSQSFTLAVAPQLAIATKLLPGAATNVVYSGGVVAVGGTPPYTITASGLPPGLSISTAGAISGLALKPGSYTVAFMAMDANGVTATAALSLPVAVPGALHVSGGALSAGIAGDGYSDLLRATGGTGPFTWSVSAGSLPSGFSLTPSGTLQGIATQAGSFSFTAQAVDATGASASGAFSFDVSPAALKLSATALPSGIAGADYPAQILTVSGGVTPYKFALVSGSLPDGLSLSNGQIAGVPLSPGMFTFTIALTDSSTPAKVVSGGYSILIRAAQRDLILSAGAVSFGLNAGATGLPYAANVTVRSSLVQQVLNYGVTVSPSAGWLDVSTGGATPGAISIGLNSQALTLPAGDYQASVAVSCVAQSQCVTALQTILVSLTVDTPPAALGVANTLLSFSTGPGGAAPAPQTMSVENDGGGVLGISGIDSPDSWVRISGIPSSLASGAPAAVRVDADPAGLAPGYYRSVINVRSSAGSVAVPAGLLIAPAAAITLSPGGTQFLAPAGSSPGNSAGSFAVLVSGNGAVDWSAATLPGAPWLSLTTAAGAAASSVPGAVNFSLDRAAVSALTPGTYYATIRVTPAGASGSPQDFQVVLNIAAAADPLRPDPQPAGLVFLSSGAGALSPQTVQVFASAAAAVPYQAAAQVEGNVPWLSVSPSTGQASIGAPGSATVMADPTGLAPGVYRGGVTYAFRGSVVSTVNVTLIVQPHAGSVANGISGLQPKAQTCAASRLVPTQTGLANNFSQATAWPTPLAIRVANDCGSSVTQSLVTVTFSNGDPPLGLTMSDPATATYTGTWTPRNAAAQVTIAARATAPGYNAATVQITGQVKPNTAPLLTPNGTLHVFDPQVGGALGPGNIVQIYGSGFSTQTILASSIPLPRSLGGTSVLIGGIEAPLYFVSPQQINAQIPFELDSGRQYQILVNANGALTTPDNVQLSAVAPGIAAFASGQIIAQHLDGTLVSADAPAKPGESVVCYLAGLGTTDNPVVTGAASPGDALARPIVPPSLSLNGATIPLQFAGLTPGLVGLYQANFAIPTNMADGDVRLVISQSGVPSNATILPVRH